LDGVDGPTIEDEEWLHERKVVAHYGVDYVWIDHRLPGGTRGPTLHAVITAARGE